MIALGIIVAIMGGLIAAMFIGFRDRVKIHENTIEALARYAKSLSEEIKRVNSRVDDVAEISSDVYEWKEEIVKIAAKRPTVDLRKREIRHG